MLVPQADTEVIVEKAVSLSRSGMKIADICCGSGCIGLSVLKNTENTTADMFDISDGACEITVKMRRHSDLRTEQTFFAVMCFQTDFLTVAENMI